MQSININFFSFFYANKIHLDNTLKILDSKKTLLYDVNNDIKFMLKYLDTENIQRYKDDKKIITQEKFIYDNLEFFELSQSQISRYIADIEILKYVSDNLNTAKNRNLSKAYNNNLNLSRQYYKVYIGYTAKDTRRYFAIDGRQKIFKDNYIKFAYEQYLKHNIGIKEFRKFQRYGIMSDNLRERIGIYNTTILNKVSHKKYKQHKTRYTREEYIYIPKYHRLIRFKKYGNKNIFDLFTTKSIYQEIQHKKSFELDLKNLYSYSRIN